MNFSVKWRTVYLCYAVFGMGFHAHWNWGKQNLWNLGLAVLGQKTSNLDENFINLWSKCGARLKHSSYERVMVEETYFGVFILWSTMNDDFMTDFRYGFVLICCIWWGIWFEMHNKAKTSISLSNWEERIHKASWLGGEVFSFAGVNAGNQVGPLELPQVQRYLLDLFHWFRDIY